jgi:hypothetical protein
MLLSPETGVLTSALTYRFQESVEGISSPFLDLPLFCYVAFSLWPHFSVLPTSSPTILLLPRDGQL